MSSSTFLALTGCLFLFTVNHMFTFSIVKELILPTKYVSYAEIFDMMEVYRRMQHAGSVLVTILSMLLDPPLIISFCGYVGYQVVLAGAMMTFVEIIDKLRERRKIKDEEYLKRD